MYVSVCAGDCGGERRIQLPWSQMELLVVVSCLAQVLGTKLESPQEQSKFLSTELYLAMINSTF